MHKMIFIALLALGLVGCNTIAGAGKDLKSVGSKIEKTAEKSKGAPDAPRP
jgi:predicted small secreted protein